MRIGKNVGEWSVKTNEVEMKDEKMLKTVGKRSIFGKNPGNPFWKVNKAEGGRN